MSATAMAPTTIVVRVECQICSRESKAMGGYERRVSGLFPTTLPGQRCPNCRALLDAAPVLAVVKGARS